MIPPCFYASYFQLVQHFDRTSCRQLKELPPTRIIAIAAFSFLCLETAYEYFQTEQIEFPLEQKKQKALDSAISLLPTEMAGENSFDHQAEALSKWRKFGSPQLRIPEKRWSFPFIVEWLETFDANISKALKDLRPHDRFRDQISEQAYRGENLKVLAENFEKEVQENNGINFKLQAKMLEQLLTIGLNKSFLWNALDSHDLPIKAYIDYQVIQMAARSFGGSSHEVDGFISAGSAESLKIAVLKYRDWGMKQRNHQKGEGIIIASRTVHQAVFEAGKTYFVNVLRIDTDQEGRIDLEKLIKAVKKYGRKIVAIIGSASTYPNGTMDPIAAMAHIALNSGCGMHVDCCFGGMTLPFLPGSDTKFLKLTGVTSLSVDMHQNELSPSSSSLLLTKRLGSKNLAAPINEFNVLYPFPKHSEGQSWQPALNAFLAMLAIGENGYRKIAEETRNSAIKLSEQIEAKFNGKLQLIAAPSTNVTAFKIDSEWRPETDATMTFAIAMQERNYPMNVVENMLSFSVNQHFASDPDSIEKFRFAVAESLHEIEKFYAQQLVNADVGLFLH